MESKQKLVLMKYELAKPRGRLAFNGIYRTLTVTHVFCESLTFPPSTVNINPAIYTKVSQTVSFFQVFWGGKKSIDFYFSDPAYPLDIVNSYHVFGEKN